MASEIFDWVSPIGGNWAFWAINQKTIGNLISANKLAPVSIGVVGPAAPAARMVPGAAAERAWIDLGIRGGIRDPHLHFENRIYMLNAEQWARFSEGVVSECKAALAKVREIGFEQTVALGSLTSTLVPGK